MPIEGWTLRIHGMVDNEIELTYADILERKLTENRITMTCVSNPVGGEYLGNALWLGIPLHELLGRGRRAGRRRRGEVHLAPTTSPPARRSRCSPTRTAAPWSPSA